MSEYSEKSEIHRKNRRRKKRATNLVAEIKNISYIDRLKHLQIPKLPFRRQRGDMIEIYKIIRGMYDREVRGFLKM